MSEQVAKIFREREEREREFVDRYGYARPLMAVKFGESMVVTVGGSIYKQIREGDSTFLHMIHSHALLMFGELMLETEEKKRLMTGIRLCNGWKPTFYTTTN